MIRLRYLFIIFILFLCIKIQAQIYKDWNKHSITSIYEKIHLDSGTLDDDGEEIEFVLVPTKLDEGVYEIELGDKLGTNVYQILGTELFIKFQFNPFLYKWDKGVLEWNGYYSNSFYEAP